MLFIISEVLLYARGASTPFTGRTVTDIGTSCTLQRLLEEREFLIDNLLVRVHFIIVMIRWTGLAAWEFEFPFPGSLTSTFLGVPPRRP